MDALNIANLLGAATLPVLGLFIVYYVLLLLFRREPKWWRWV